MKIEADTYSVLAVCYQCSKYFTGVNLELLTTLLWYKCYRYLCFIDEERRPRVVEYLHWIPWNQDLGKGTLAPEPKLSYTLYSVQGGLKEKKYLRKWHEARASIVARLRSQEDGMNLSHLFIHLFII